MWRGEKILGYWLPFLGLRDVEVPRLMVRLRGVAPGMRTDFVAQWFGIGFKVFFRIEPRP